MSILNPDLAQLGGTAVVAIIALWAIVQLFREKKKNGNGNSKNGEIIEKINSLENTLDVNHFSSLEKRFDNQDGKLDQIITLLTEVKTILKNKDK